MEMDTSSLCIENNPFRNIVHTKAREFHESKASSKTPLHRTDFRTALYPTYHSSPQTVNCPCADRTFYPLDEKARNRLVAVVDSHLHIPYDIAPT